MKDKRRTALNRQYLSEQKPGERLSPKRSTKSKVNTTLSTRGTLPAASKRRAQFLNGVIEKAVRLLRVKSAGIYQYFPASQKLRVIVDYNRQHKHGRILKIGEGMAGRLMANRKRFMIIDDYNSWKHRAQVFATGREFGAVLEVPVKKGGVTFGVLYVDDEVGRKFTPEDARLLELFADQAVIALERTNSLFRDEWKLRRHEKLSQATLEILENLRSATVDERLSHIALSAANVLEAESCGVFLVREGMLSLEASYGHRLGSFKKGMRLAIRSAPKSGLTGHIAYQGRAFRMHGEKLKLHRAVSGVGPSHTHSRFCKSILAIPLFEGANRNKRLIGLIRVDNKKGFEDAATDDSYFTEEDESILKVFAKTVIVAIGSTIFIEHLRQTQRSLSDAVGLLDIGAQREKATGLSQLEIDLVGGVTAQVEKLGERLNKFSEQEELLTKIRRLKENREIVVSLTALGNHAETLQYVANATQADLDSDVVVLYVYDQLLSKLAFPPVYSGNLLSEEPWLPYEIPRTSISYKMLETDDVYIVHNTAADPSFKNRPFTTREKIASCIACPLIAMGQKVGVMFVNYRSPHPFSKEDVHSVRVSASQAAVAIHNAQLFKQSQNRARALEALYEAGQAMTSTLQLKPILDEFTNQALYIAGETGSDECFSHVGLLRGSKFDFISASPSRVLPRVKQKLAEVDITNDLKKIGITGRAVHLEEVQMVGDVKNDIGYIEIHPNVNSQLSVPLKVENKVIGVLTIEHPRPQAFTIEDRRNVSLLASQAAVSIQNALSFETTKREKEQLEGLHKAARRMAAQFELRNLLEAVVESAREVLEADSAVLLPYEHEKRRFVPNEPTGAGIARAEFDRIVADKSILRMAEKVLRNPSQHQLEGVVSVEDLSTLPDEWLSTRARKTLTLVGIQASQAIALRIGREPVGVLFVNYHKPRQFTKDDQIKLQGFANYAALSLKKSRLLLQVQAVKIISDVVAHLTALGDKEGSFKTIAAGAQAASNCDVVVMFVCDSASGEFEPNPIIAGHDSPHVRSASEMSRNSVVYKVMRRSKPYAAETVSDNPLFKQSRFVRSGNFKSCLAFPLIALGQKVGVIFLNYRTPHYFTNEEIKNIQQYVTQASVVVSNSQTFEQAEARARVLEGLNDAGKAVTNDLRLKPTLDEIAKQALLMVGNVPGSFSHVALLKEGILDFVTVSPPEKEVLYGKKLTKSYLNRAKGRIGIAGRAAKQGKTLNVPYVKSHEDYHRISVDIRSQLSVPLKALRKEGARGRKKVIGVLSIEHPRRSAFTAEDVRNISLLASQAGVAIQNAQQFDELARTKGLVGSRSALAWMGMTSNAWRHAIVGYASNICNELTLLASEFDNSERDEHFFRVLERRLNFIERQAKKILAKEIDPPYAWSQGAKRFAINAFIVEWEKRLGSTESQPPDFLVELKQSKENPFVRCSQDWLTEAFDILMENAIEATEGLSPRRLRISSKALEDRVEITFSDNGKGIPQDLYQKLFKERIRMPRTKGLGVGLLMVQAIVQAYGGDIRAAPPSGKGATLIVTLRRERKS